MRATQRHSKRLCHATERCRHAYYDARSGYTRFGSTHSSSLLSPHVLAAATVTAGGYIYVTHLETVPVTGRKHFILCSVDTERRLGAAAYYQIRKQFANAIVPAFARDAQRVERVSRRILDVLPGVSGGRPELAHLKNTTWEFTVVNSPQINAFAVPNGKVVVFTGLLRLFPNDDELAVVIAHEIAHVVARHSAEKVSTGLVTAVLKMVLALATGEHGATDAVVDVGLNLPFSRRAETEADSIGIQLMARACFDPTVAPRVFEKLAAQQRHEPPAWLSTHPAGKDRAAHVAKEAPKAQQVYHSHGCSDWRHGMQTSMRGSDL